MENWHIESNVTYDRTKLNFIKKWWIAHCKIKIFLIWQFRNFLNWFSRLVLFLRNFCCWFLSNFYFWYVDIWIKVYCISYLLLYLFEFVKMICLINIWSNLFLLAYFSRAKWLKLHPKAPNDCRIAGNLRADQFNELIWFSICIFLSMRLSKFI